ncbi:hypothetical protein [Paraburkholderia sp.]|uniref:hypothetical protein n=1 Tax=Paraburkholderia sp. TaxID=1926495 RepID=UPI003D6FB7AE
MHPASYHASCAALRPAPIASARSTRRCARLSAALALVVATLTLNGCAWTLISIVDATGSVIQAGYAAATHYSSPSYVTGKPLDVPHVCIEVNQTVTTGDFVPALQTVLTERGVRSDLYNPGTSPPGCEAQLVYAASIDYGQRAFSDEPTPYLSTIDLTLLQRGRVVVTARYETRGLATDRFSTASVKLGGLVSRMVVDRHAQEKPALQASRTD